IQSSKANRYKRIDGFAALILARVGGLPDYFESKFNRGSHAYQTRITSTPCRVNFATASSVAPVSVTRTCTLLIGQISDGDTSPSLLESPTRTTCFACSATARNVAASSASFVVTPRSASMPVALKNNLSM